nr:MarR family winged helix-turn-helix transcriptional regulator [uncultured Actinoplanes sp.]
MSNTEDDVPADRGAAPASALGPGFLLAQLGRLAQQRWTSWLAEAGLTQLELATLSALAQAGPARQRDAATMVGVDPRNAVATVARLVERGLVTATSSTRDERSKVLAVSPAGARRLEQLSGEVVARGTAFFEILSPQEYALLHRLLESLYAHHFRRRPEESYPATA